MADESNIGEGINPEVSQDTESVDTQSSTKPGDPLEGNEELKRLSIPFILNVSPRTVILVLLRSKMSSKRNSIGEAVNTFGGHPKTNHGNYQTKLKRLTMATSTSMTCLVLSSSRTYIRLADLWSLALLPEYHQELDSFLLMLTALKTSKLLMAEPSLQD
jgi:hypothetical protein